MADVDVTRLAGNLRCFSKLDSGAVILEDGGGASLRKTIRREQVAKVGDFVATAGQADILGLHTRQGDTRVLGGRRADNGGGELTNGEVVTRLAGSVGVHTIGSIRVTVEDSPFISVERGALGPGAILISEDSLSLVEV